MLDHSQQGDSDQCGASGLLFSDRRNDGVEEGYSSEYQAAGMRGHAPWADMPDLYKLQGNEPHSGRTSHEKSEGEQSPERPLQGNWCGVADEAQECEQGQVQRYCGDTDGNAPNFGPFAVEHMAAVDDAVGAAADGGLRIQRGPCEVAGDAKSCEAEQAAEQGEPGGALWRDGLQMFWRGTTGSGCGER